MMQVFLVGMFFTLLVAMVFVRKTRNAGSTITSTVTKTIATVIDSPELRARVNHIKVMRRRIRWAYRRLEKPHLCKSWTRARARRYMEESRQEPVFRGTRDVERPFELARRQGRDGQSRLNNKKEG